MDLELIFKLGGVGIILVILDKVLESSGKKDIAAVINIAGIVVILTMIISLIGNLFSAVKTMFMM